MEAFSLLKYWRGGGGGAAAISAAASTRPAVAVTTIATSVQPSAEETDDESGEGDDEGPFFDLEFAVPDEDCEGDGNEDEDDGGSSSREGDEGEEATDEECAAEEREFNFTVSSEGSCSDLRADPALQLSPSDDLFFKGRLVPLESSSLVFNPSEGHAKPHMLPVSLLKTKFRVLMLGFKKPKRALAAAAAGDGSNGSAAAVVPSPKHPQQRPSKLFTIKFKVEEVPIMSLFTRDNSSRSNGSNNGRASKQADECSASMASAGEKRLPKELVQKYLNKIKPLYVRVSKRYAEKLRFSGQLSTEPVVSKEPPAPAPAPAPAPTPPSAGCAEVEQKSGEAEPPPAAAAAAAAPGVACTANAAVKPAQLGNLPAGLRVVCKHLGKSRSASAAVAAVPSPPPSLTQRRDDSLLQQQDGIQSAIAHCKMSFNASKEVDSSQLATKTEAPLDRATVDRSRTCSDKAKEDCI